MDRPLTIVEFFLEWSHKPVFRFEKCLNQGMKRECILSENELNKKRKIIQRNKIRKILNEADQLSPEEISMLDHG